MKRLAPLIAAALVLSSCGSSEPAADPTASPLAPTATAVLDATEAPEPTAASTAASIAPASTPTSIPAPPTPQVITGGEGPTGDLLYVSRDWTTDWSTRTINLDELRIGIQVVPIRDRIPPIDNPEFAPTTEAGWTDPEPGLLLVMGDTARFYPLAMLIVHEIVNDEIDGRPVLVTYCPLCNSALVFDPVVDGQRLRFGTSGLLRNSDLVMWDDATESLWQQIGGEGLVGTYAGHRLDVIPSAIVSWSDFKAGYPDGVVLDPPGRPASSYGRNPYVQYTSRTSPIPGFFDSTILDDRYPALERTVGVTVNDHDKAYPFSVVQANRALNDTVAGVPVVVLWSPGTADALDSPVTAEGMDVGAALAFDRRVDGEALEFAPAGDGRFTDDQTGSTWNVLGQAVDGELTGARLEPVVHTNEFWFAWSAFHPNGEVFGP
ncbi:MAG: DUF3179 domain-containing protein [Acidimicrobiia bacterium]|nr:DUF3179 domain-containing protein [Acidimicrobiia bacterium]MYG58060.1 DUF3179 domain-containing protein [Acidimicrobiia bacterium]MYJ32549.1 DUF3179 domain-containing protein [Acidimicrobiia bacterium]